MLTLVKFLVGTRVVMLFFLSNTQLSFRQFARYNTLAIFLWMLVILPIGFISGLGFTYLAEIFENIYAGLGFVLLVIVLLIVFEIRIKKKLTQLHN